MRIVNGTSMEGSPNFRWARGARHKVSAQAAGEVFSELEESGELTPEKVVDVSRPEDAALHKEFEWDDAVAAEKYRGTQASAMIRHIVVEVEMPPRDEEDGQARISYVEGDDVAEDEQPRIELVRAYHPSHDGEAEKGSYESTMSILMDDGKRAVLLGDAERDMRAFVRKYAILGELSGVIESMNEVLG